MSKSLPVPPVLHPLVPSRHLPQHLIPYREAELAHGRVAMLAIIGFFVGEQVEGSAFIFDANISGPAITRCLRKCPREDFPH